jgi:hypothetical protein
MSHGHPPCRECGGHLQHVPSMPGHLACGSGHLYLESDIVPSTPQGGPAATPLTRVGGERRPGPPETQPRR